MQLTDKYADCGVLYYTLGARYVHEVVQSAKSLKQQMPNILVAIVTNESLPGGLFDHQINHDPTIGVKHLKMWSLLKSPFTRTLYLDTDTYVADSVWEIFDILDKFHLAATVTPFWSVSNTHQGGAVYDKGIPVAFPKINGGVLAFRNDSLTKEFISDWAERHQKAGGGQDQPHLRAALYHSQIRYATLPQAYNYRLPYPSGISGTIKIFHGRAKNLPEICSDLNQTEDWRVTAPVNRQFVLFRCHCSPH